MTTSRWTPRRLTTTREGKAVILVTLGLGFGAINSGNNLLFLILGMLLSLIVVSGVLSEFTVRDVVVTRRRSGGIHAGTDAFLPVDLENRKTRLASFGVEVEERFAKGPNAPTQRPAYALILAPGERAGLSVRVRAPRRGVVASEGIRVATRYPFGFFRKSREIHAPDEILVWPALRAVRMPELHSPGRYGLDNDSARAGRGEEYHALREHRVEDDPRDVHWKTSARLGRIVTREYEAPATRRIWLHVSLGCGPEAAPAFEGAVSDVASLAALFLGQGYSVGLRTQAGDVAPAPGSGQLPVLFDHLALLTAAPDAPELLPAPGEGLLVRYEGQRAASSAGFGRVFTSGGPLVAEGEPARAV